jgi:predicted phosphoadenosine phosphosulfate sulfurtransferase
MGHAADSAFSVGETWFSGSQEWIDAMAKDKAVSGLESFTAYGKNANSEDFAESIANYFTKHDEFTKKMPNRTAIIERLLGIGGT